MAKHPKLEALDGLFSSGKDFQLTDAQYESKTGVMLPKAKSYLVNQSALARKAAKNGYRISVIEKTVIFSKEKEK